MKKNKKINILIVIPYFYPEAGGAENYTYNVAKRLTKKGFDITIVCSSRNKINKEEIIDGIKVIRQKPSFVVSATPIKLNLYFTISKLLKENDFHLLISYTPVPFYVDIAAIISRKFKIPFILTYHNDTIKYTFPMNLIANIYNRTFGILTRKISEPIITTSPYCYNESKFLKPFKDKLVLITPGVNIKKYRVDKSFTIYDVHELPLSSNIVLFVGQLSKTHAHKGVDDLIKSFKKVLEDVKNVCLIIVGTGDAIPEYKKMCEELEILGKVIFTGFVDEDKLIEYYMGSDVVVLPSTTVAEGFGMVLIEGNACGKPVIGTKIGGIQYVIKDGETGLLVPPKNPEALADAIIKLLSDEDLSKNMGENGRKLVEQNYTWENTARMTEKVYRGVIYG